MSEPRSFAASDISNYIEISSDAIAIIAQNGLIVATNSAMLNLFDYDTSEVVNMPVEMLIPEHLRMRHERHRTHYFRSTPQARPMGTGLRLMARKRDGSEFPVDISLVPIYVDDALHVLASIRDNTDLAQIRDSILEIRPTFQRIDAFSKLWVRIGSWLIPLIVAQSIVYVIQFILKLLGH